MKHNSILTTLIALMFVVTISKAQIIPNGGFENWTSFGTYSDPTSWTSFNVFTSLAGAVTCENGTPGAIGTSYLKLTVKNVTGFGLTEGYAVSAPPNSGSGGLTPGFAFNARPANLTGKWQFKATGSDSSSIEVFMFKWNTATKTSDLVAVGDTIITASSVTSWTNFSIPIFNFGGVTPDSALIIISAGISTPPVLNDYLYIDDLAFTGGSVGINEMDALLNITVAPNPFTSQTTITFNEEQSNTSIKIMDVMGKEIKTINFTGKQLAIEKEGMKEGIYFLQITDEKKNVQIKKILVQ